MDYQNHLASPKSLHEMPDQNALRFTTEEYDIVPFLIETIYYYITAHYKAGQQTISGKTVHTHTTTDKNRIRLCQNPYYLNQ